MEGQRTLGSISPIVLILGTLILAAGAGAISVVVTAEIQWTAFETSMLVLLGLFSLLPLLLIPFQKQRDLFNPFYLIAAIFSISYFLSPLLMIATGNVRRYVFDLRTQFAEMVLIALVGLIAAYLGYFWGMVQFHGTRSKAVQRLFARELDPRNLFRWTLVSIMVAISLYVLWAILAGVPINAILNIVLDDEANYTSFLEGSRTSSLYLYLFRDTLPVLSLTAWVYAPDRRWKWITSMIFAVTLLVFVLTGNRGSILLLVVPFVVVWYLQRGTRPSLRLLFAGMLIFALVSGVLVQIRGRTSAADLSYENIVDQNLREITERGAAVGTMIVTSFFPERYEHLGFRIFADFLITPIPRALWPDKPTNTRTVHAMLEPYYEPYPLPAFDVPAIYYAGFGLIGTALACALFGTLLAYSYRQWQFTPQHPSRQIFLAMVLPFALIVFHRGDLTFIVIRFLYQIFPLFLLWFVAARIRIGR
jgi:oligosaccharide repeat unit polymerase